MSESSKPSTCLGHAFCREYACKYLQPVENNRHAAWRSSIFGSFPCGAAKKVLEGALPNCFPESRYFHPCFTIPDLSPKRSRGHKIVHQPLSIRCRVRGAINKHYLPLMPLALEQIDLRGYDLVISNDQARPKGSYPPAGAAAYLLLSTRPMRLRLEHVFTDYREHAGLVSAVLMMPPLCHYLRIGMPPRSMRVGSLFNRGIRRPSPPRIEKITIAGTRR